MAKRTQIDMVRDEVVKQPGSRLSVRKVALALRWSEEKVHRVVDRAELDDSVPLYFGPSGTVMFRGSERGSGDGIYKDVRRVVETYWAERRGYKDVEVFDTARTGHHVVGVWAHPDIVIAANPRRRRHATDPRQLHSVEIEHRNGFDIRSVYQAHAEGRGADFAWVFYAKAAKVERHWDRIRWAAEETKVGLIEFGRPGSWTTWRVVREAAKRDRDVEDRAAFCLNTGIPDE